MDEGQFDMALIGDGAARVLHNGKCDRIRYHVAGAIDTYARERQAEGRPDRAALLRYISGEVRSGGTPSKKSVSKAGQELATVARRICSEWSPGCDDVN